MSLQVELVSQEMVKPSSPTPQHLRHYHLSFLDQYSLQIHNSMVYFFDDGITSKFNIIEEASDLLKKSLSQVLTHYYPLAGRLRIKNLLVDCNDDGVPYKETRVRCHLRHVIDSRSPADVSRLLPYDMDEIVDTVLSVQFNVFDCGGIAVGVCLSHKIADAMSYFQFIKSWAAVTRGEPPEQIKTHFQSSSLFPPKEVFGYDPNVYIGENKIVGKMFVFESSAIESLRTKYSQKMENVLEGQKPPSRVEVLQTFLFNRLIAATKNEDEGPDKIHLLTYAVNLRPRMEPPLPEYAFGNYYWSIEAFPILMEEGECKNLGRQLREELKKVDKDFTVKLRESKEWKFNREETGSEIAKGEIVLFIFTSLCRFPVYEVDFGWGNPTWAAPPTWKFKNFVTLKDTKSGGGIEAYVNLAEDDMAKFERDEELLAYVSIARLK
ncbi:stemmadenine O-acetyltransferase-like [Prosopis cineraria]|uniref:stemmadenine O-acetyltransferase-like n=1 Tax=Prosopis cineraria TaxID=364024 RepID=UPI002410235D|nr:stemmadenine O-acetyltransferase-like [Prosopis cineraria]